MSSIDDRVLNDVVSARDATWSVRNGTKVPKAEDVTLSTGGVEIQATYLYADMANSSKMARDFDRRVTAKLLKSFLAASSRQIRYFGGQIMSFDGDRVMGAFMGDTKNTDAVRCAFGITYAVEKIIRPKFEQKYESVRTASFEVSHATGIDTGKVFIVRGGVNGSNELISIGRAPNLAAKLSDIRKPGYTTLITDSVYNVVLASVKKRLNGDYSIWTAMDWNFNGEPIDIHGCSYWRKPSIKRDPFA